MPGSQETPQPVLYHFVSRLIFFSALREKEMLNREYEIPSCFCRNNPKDKHMISKRHKIYSERSTEFILSFSLVISQKDTGKSGARSWRYMCTAKIQKSGRLLGFLIHFASMRNRETNGCGRHVPQ